MGRAMTYERPILSRYTDPLELIWLAAARRLGLTVRRDPTIFSRTNGEGGLWLGPREDLDPDDNVCQMLLHELCHWVTNGVGSFAEQDWGFPLDDKDDPREFACLRLQAWLADRHGLRDMLGPTGIYRAYYDTIPADPLAPLDGDAWEATIVRLAHDAILRVQQPPFFPTIDQALADTARMRAVVAPWMDAYCTDLDDDGGLPSIWGPDRLQPGAE